MVGQYNHFIPHLHSASIAELAWLALLRGASLFLQQLLLLLLLWILLIQCGIEIAILVGLHAIGQRAHDTRGIVPINVVVLQLLHRLIAYDLRHLGQRVVGLQHGQRLGQKLERLIAYEFTRKRGRA